MAGHVKDGGVVVPDPREASQLHNRGGHGTPLSGGALALEMEEAAYLVECGRLEVSGGEEGPPMTLGGLMEVGSALDRRFDIRYLVYRDLRSRGYVVKRFSHELYKVFERGEATRDHTSKYLLLPTHERSALPVKKLREHLDTARFTRKGLLAGIVDEEGDLTYYEASVKEPRGKGHPRDGDVAPRALDRGHPVDVSLLGDRGFVDDTAGASELHSRGYYGKPMGDMLQLSLLETHHLQALGAVHVTDPIEDVELDPGRVLQRGVELQEEFLLRHRLYSDLRSRGLTVKTGFKYGTHFRVYRGDPAQGHSEHLCHAVGAGAELSWPLLSRSVRVAHGVRKKLILGIAPPGEEDPPVYIQVTRERP